MPALPPAPDSPPMASAVEPAVAPWNRNLAWVLLLGLTALLVFSGLWMNVQSLSLTREEKAAIQRDQRLSSQLNGVAQHLTALQLHAWAHFGTAGTADRDAFQLEEQQLKTLVDHLAVPQNFPELRRKRLELIPTQTSAVLERLRAAVQRRSEGKLTEALAQLQQSRSATDTLQLTVQLLTENAQDAIRDRQQAAENTRVGLQAEIVVHCVLLALLLLCTYLVLRAERDFQAFRERQFHRKNQHLQELTEEDGLTGLYNRRAFDDRLRLEWRRAQRYGIPLSLMMLDVDNFKKYNDAYGHQEGDEVLRRMAAALAQTARLTDTIARYGGEEFVILLPHTGRDESLIVGERLRTILHNSVWPHPPVTASIGLATLNASIRDADSLVSAADAAQYYAKHNGKDRVVHADLQNVGA